MGSLDPEKGTLIQAMDALTTLDPARLYCIQPKSSDISHGWKNISFADMQGAVNHTVSWIQENCMASTGNQPQVLAYMGANDVRYLAFIFACMRLRHTALLLSPRNSVEASRHVLGATGCSKFVFTAERRRQIEELRTMDPGIQAWEIPDLWVVFDRSEIHPTPVKGVAIPDEEGRVAVYIHSSGTTGLPKPLPMTNGYFQAIKKTGFLPVPDNRESSLTYVAEKGKLFFTMSPFFHFMGLLKLVCPIFFGTPFVLGPDRPLTVDLLSQIIDETRPQTATLPPSLLADLSVSEKGVECLRQFDMITYGGAPLASEVGDRVTELTHLQSVLGSSECGLFGSLKNQDRGDWGYLEWNPAHGLEMRDVGDGLYELVVSREANRKAHSIFHVFPDKEEFRTGDLFAPHPWKEGLWLYNGRMDDLVVLSNGEKFNPTSMEEVIATHPIVRRVVIIGQGRFQSAALIEPDWSALKGDPNALIDQIWHLVEKANNSAPGHARLMRNRICVTSQDLPFKLTPKGTIQRRRVVTDYADVIDSLYADTSQGDVAQIGKDASISDIEKYLSNTVSSLLSVPEIDNKTDIFTMGLDSLQTLRLGQILHQSLQTARPDLTSAVFSSQRLYSRPSISQLGEYVLSLLQGHDASPAADDSWSESDSNRAERITNLVNKYADNLGESHAVILTGSTGSLGSYLLSELCNRGVNRIYCLNRSSDAAARQLKSFHEKGLASFDKFPSHVEFLKASFGEERFGLEKTKYEELLQAVDTVIHNAWKVNFNHRVEAFEDTHIEGVRRLVDFSIASKKTAHIHFVSSVSTIQGFSSQRGPTIPEVIFEDPTVVLRQGYGESKHISERICATASAKCGIPTSIHRVGQIGGPTTEKGMWNKQEWLPSLVATSKTVGKIPTSLGSVSVQWVPVDITAKVIADIVQNRRTTQDKQPCAAFHLVNPSTADWQSLVSAITKYCNVQKVDLQDWIQTLEGLTNITEQDLIDKPALKLLDFFKAIARVKEPGPRPETVKTQLASKTMKDLKAIDAPLMENWMKQWSF